MNLPPKVTEAEQPNTSGPKPSKYIFSYVEPRNVHLPGRSHHKEEPENHHRHGQTNRDRQRQQPHRRQVERQDQHRRDLLDHLDW